ncbi:hypothetical protein F2P79_004933 [Pimephales promelas]|nr:hypothetical protein F2P79_004933 [Pimephales promelas]
MEGVVRGRRGLEETSSRVPLELFLCAARVSDRGLTPTRVPAEGCPDGLMWDSQKPLHPQPGNPAAAGRHHGNGRMEDSSGDQFPTDGM